MLDRVTAALAVIVGVLGPAGPEAPGLPDTPAGTASAGLPRLTYTGKAFPPEGSAADQELLKALLQAQAGVGSERAIASRTTRWLSDAGLDARLAALQEAQTGEQAARSADLRRRLRRAWADVTEVMTARWMVDPRLGCRQEGIELEVLMGVAPGAPAYAGLPVARTKARSCLERQLVMLRPLERANRALQGAIAEARTALASGSRSAAGDPAGVPAQGAAGGAAPSPPGGG